MSVVLNEEFESPQGQWENYDAYDPALRDAIRGQKHVDIRNMYSADIAAQRNVLELSVYELGDLAGLTMTQVGALATALKKGEHWTPGVIWKNLLRNPSAEVNTTDMAGNLATLSRVVAGGGIGTAFYRAVSTVASGGWGIYNSSPATRPVVTPGLTYTFLATVIALPGGRQAQLGVEWYTSGDVFVSSSAETASGATGLRRYKAVAPPTAGKAMIKLYVTTGAISDVLDADGFMVVEGDYNGPYFDGTITGHQWTGTPHLSTSEEVYATQSLAANNYWRAYVVPVKSGLVSTVSSITDPINLSDGFTNTDSVSLSLPNWPGSASVTLATSFLDMTSNPNGDFTIGPTASVTLSASANSLSAAVNQEGRWPRSSFSTIDLSKVTGVRLRLAGNGTAVVSLGALRLLSDDWKYSTLDIDTRFNTLVRPMSRNGDPAAAIEYAQPIVWRASDVPGENDPRPIDFNLAVGFNTGARQGSNQISIYGRELTEDFMQQLDLNGQTQGAFTGREQPDLGAAMYNERVQTDLEPFKQDQLGGLKQFDLERTPDYLSASWIEFVLNWTATGTTLSVVNTEGDGYSFNLGTPLTANTSYVLVFELEDTSARAAIYPLGDRGEIRFNAPVFDSTQIDDDFSYKRRKGRFGWYASLADGDASIESIRFRSASYAEYRSLPYESLTPVVGAELTAEASPPIDLFEYFVPTNTSIKVEADNELSSSGHSWRVTDFGPYGFQGVQSNPFPITDFDQTEVLLDVYYPSSAELDATVEFYLKSQYSYLIPLPKPKVYPDQWQTVRLRTPSAHLAQTGDYRLVVIQNRPANLNWWIDNVRVFERTVSWHGRAYVEDPWAETEDDWTPFQNAFNRDYGGILFQGRENRLQVKGVGHKQDSTVGKVQFKPKYAELGRFVWPEQALTGRIPPVASYSTSNTGRLYTFNGFGSSDVDGMVINWQWSISDGSVYTGPVIQHLFGQAGTYAVTLMVTDHNGLVHTTSANHSVA